MIQMILSDYWKRNRCHGDFAKYPGNYIFFCIRTRSARREYLIPGEDYPGKYIHRIMFRDEIEREWCVSKVEQKVAEYRKSDQLERAKRGNIPTISADDAMQLLEETGGICSCCGNTMKLFGWPRKPVDVPTVLAEGYNEQFSFDRINNNDTHHRDNLRVVCLKCNILSADMIFTPNYEIRSGNSPYAAWQEYEYIKIAFNKLEYVCIRGKNNDLIDADIWKYHRALKSYMAYLHDLIYGDFDSDGNLVGSRKQNNWKKFGIEADGSQPHIGVLKQSFARYNMEYYDRELISQAPPLNPSA